jgi:hypothetical protein
MPEGRNQRAALANMKTYFDSLCQNSSWSSITGLFLEKRSKAAKHPEQKIIPAKRTVIKWGMIYDFSNR